MTHTPSSFFIAAVALSVVACSPPKAAESGTTTSQETCDGPSSTREVWVVDSLHFARIADGVSEGFDLDGIVSTTGGTTGCGRGDFVTPAGVTGVDNSFGEIIPALEGTEFVGAEALINDTIRTGELMLLVWADGVDDPEQDDCIDMSLGRAIGEPMLGTDGNFLAGQTLEMDADFDGAHLSNMAIVDGSMEGRPITATLPVQILNASLEFRLVDGAVRLDRLPDGHAKGALAGGVNVQEVLSVAREQGIAQEVGDILESLLGVVADLSPNDAGQCTQLSITFEFTATPVYLYTDP